MFRKYKLKMPFCSLIEVLFTSFPWWGDIISFTFWCYDFVNLKLKCQNVSNKNTTREIEIEIIMTRESWKKYMACLEWGQPWRSRLVV